MLVVLALAVNAIDLRLESSLETIDSANEPVPSFTIDDADIATGAITSLQIDNPGNGYVNGTISATGGGGSGFSGTFTVNSSGAIVSWSITSHGDYSSNPTIVIDGPQSTGSNGALSVVARSTVIDVNITNVGSVTVPVNEVWVFLDGENARNLATLATIADSEYIYPGDTVGVVWRGLGNTVFETAALSCNGFNTARTLE
jgi:hypothetical protein